ncbi:hypothetical protein [Paracoccus alkanivorans]|uniref:Uncharacterized protein n=1 Tax=Paracoccus alkanivorans TaxID=2116655 RepID=A0A3M0MP79_9RHOB|nr:hypothetical protein [Paracoccus alkanivorans]RMC37520.1 hypothetical protein C9E81_01845 [Paracoccus alkanivorans]
MTRHELNFLEFIQGLRRGELPEHCDQKLAELIKAIQQSKAPDAPLPIDLPAVGGEEPPSPLQTLGRRDLVYIAIGMFACFAGGALAMWVLR